jgi:hypothetical protein
VLSPYNEFSTNNPSYSYFVRSNNVILQLFKHWQRAQLSGAAIGSAMNLSWHANAIIQRLCDGAKLCYSVLAQLAILKIAP